MCVSERDRQRRSEMFRTRKKSSTPLRNANKPKAGSCTNRVCVCVSLQYKTTNLMLNNWKSCAQCVSTVYSLVNWPIDWSNKETVIRSLERYEWASRKIRTRLIKLHAENVGETFCSVRTRLKWPADETWIC